MPERFERLGEDEGAAPGNGGMDGWRVKRSEVEGTGEWGDSVEGAGRSEVGGDE